MTALDQVEDWPVEHAAVGVVRGGEVVEVAGESELVLPWASLTKLVTAYTTLMAVDQGIVDLDAPAGPEGSTVRHLLAHASGLPFAGDTPVARVGERRIYSNAGFETLAEHVAEVTGIGFADLVGENVLEPLGMADTTFAGSPAAGARGPLRDLLAFTSELTAPTLVGRDRLRQATDVTFEGLDGVLPGFGRQRPNDWGLGFELRDGKDPHWTGTRNSPRTFGHFGQSGSFLWVDPDAGIACAGLADRDYGKWAAQAWPVLADAVLEVHAGTRRR